MKNLNKVGSDLASKIPLAQESRLVSVSQIKKSSKPVDTIVDIAKDLTIANKKLNQIIKCVQSQNDVLQERVKNLESEISDCRETIMLLSTRMDAINSMYNRKEIENNSNVKINDESEMTTLTSDTTVDYLKAQPIFIDAFSSNKFDDNLLKMILKLDSDVRSVFVEYSLYQLKRITQCFEEYFKLEKLTEENDFIESMSDSLSKIFLSKNIFVFQIDYKSGDYFCNFNSNNLTISLKESNSLLLSSILSQKIQHFDDPSKEESFSSSFDPLFNPENKPILIIPIEGDGAFLVVNDAFCGFTNEDVYLSTLMKYLFSPLFNQYNRHFQIQKEKEFIQKVEQIQNDLRHKVAFNSLLPFLSESLEKFIQSEEMHIFIVDSNNDILSTFNINEEGRIIEFKYDLIGIPSFVVKNKYHLVSEFLNKDDFPCFSEDIDGWGFEKPFGAFPVFQNKEKVSANLCITGKQKFETSDIELIMSITPLLSLILPHCIEAHNHQSASEASETLNKYPHVISHITFDKLKDDKNVYNILNEMQRGVNCEIISAYMRKNDSESLEFVRLMTLSNGAIVDCDYVNSEFINFVFGNDQPVNESDPSRLPNLISVKEVDIHSIMGVVNKEIEDKKLVIICLNSKSLTGKFDMNYHSYISSFSTLIVYAMEIQKREKEIENQKKNAICLESAFAKCEEALNYPNPLLALIQSLLKHIKMSDFMLLRYKPLSKCYECILASEKCKRVNINEENSFIKQIKTLSKTTKIEKDSIEKDNTILEYFPSFLFMIIEPIPEHNLLLICSGNSVDSSYNSYFDSFLPFLKALYKNFLLSTQKVITSSSEISKIDFNSTSILDSDVSSRLFSVTNLTEPQKIEIVLKIFTSFDLLTIMETTIDDFAKFLLIAREKFRKVPYHNWNHAVDSIQFAYSIIQRGRMRKFLRPHHTIAILLAALLHDIDHKGFNTLFQINSKSPLYIVYGNESTLEKHHLAIATKLLMEALITKNKMLFKDQIFWSVFSGSILATDMTKHFDYMEKFKTLKTSFNSSNEEHLLILAQLIIKCANVGNCTRPFDVALQMAKKLQDEYSIQNEREKKIMGDKFNKENICNMEGDLADLEINFYDSIALPLLTTLGSIAPELSDFAIQTEDNKKQWNEYKTKSC